MKNKMAITMVVNQIRQLLEEKSARHNSELERLGRQGEDEPFSSHVEFMDQKPQVEAMSTILRNPATEQVDFVFYLDRLAALLVEKAMDNHRFLPTQITTPENVQYNGLISAGKVSGVVILRGGSCLETGLKRTIPDCLTGRMLIQSNYRTGEPQLHFLKLFPDIASHETVLLLDSQMSSGGAALMAVKILVDHGVEERKIVFVTLLAGRIGIKRLMCVFPDINVIAGDTADDLEERWIEKRYFGC